MIFCYFSKKIALGISCESSEKTRLHSTVGSSSVCRSRGHEFDHITFIEIDQETLSREFYGALHYTLKNLIIVQAFIRISFFHKVGGGLLLKCLITVGKTSEYSSFPPMTPIWLSETYMLSID